MRPKYVRVYVKLLLKLMFFLMFVFSTSNTMQCTSKKTERDGYVIRNVGIKLCQLKCVENGECLSIEYNSDTLTCRLSTVESAEITKKEGYVILGRDHSWVPTDACTSTKCSCGERCLVTRSGKAVCVQDEKQNYPEKSPQHKVTKQETSVSGQLYAACRKGDLDRAGHILSQGLVDIKSRDKKHGRTSLRVAAVKGHSRMFVFLTRKGSDITEVDNDGKNTPHWACKGGHVFKCVLQKYNITTNNEETPPPEQAAFRGGRERHKVVVCVGAKVLKYVSGDNVLYVASKSGLVGIVKFLLKHKIVDINIKEKNAGETPLMGAVAVGNVDIFKLLMHMGADVSQVDVVGKNVLHIACLQGRLDMLKYLISKSSVDINSLDKMGMAPLMFAVMHEHREVFEFLVRMGANVSHVDVNGNNILHLATSWGRMGMVKYILSQNLVHINARNKRGDTAAMIARRKRFLKIYKLLVSRPF